MELGCRTCPACLGYLVSPFGSGVNRWTAQTGMPGNSMLRVKGRGVVCWPPWLRHCRWPSVGTSWTAAGGQVGARGDRAVPSPSPPRRGSRDDGEVALEGRVGAVGVSAAAPPFSVGHQGQFAQCHAMGEGDGQEAVAVERSHGLRVQHRAVDPLGLGRTPQFRRSDHHTPAQASVIRDGGGLQV